MYTFLNHIFVFFIVHALIFILAFKYRVILTPSMNSYMNVCGTRLRLTLREVDILSPEDTVNSTDWNSIF